MIKFWVLELQVLVERTLRAVGLLAAGHLTGKVACDFIYIPTEALLLVEPVKVIISIVVAAVSVVMVALVVATY